MIETIAKLVKFLPPFSVQENGGVIHEYFEQNEDAEGVVLVDGDKPAGIVMRNDFYQKIGRQYGYTVYMRRNISLIMKTDITCVDVACDMAKLGIVAMNRRKDSLYDHIIVLEHEKYIGFVSIGEFLLEMSRTKEREIELLNDQQRILKQANEAEKQHRMEIEQKNASIQNLLDNAGQGFLSFGRDLVISGECSRECGEIFGHPMGNRHFLEILKECGEDSSLETVGQVFERVFAEPDGTRGRIYLSLLPKEITFRQKYIRIEYKVIDNLSEKSIMVILTDITEKKALELKNAEEKNNVKLIIKALSDRTEIREAKEELRGFITLDIPQLLCSRSSKQEILGIIFRRIHTMKGDCSLNCMYNTARELHKLEDILSDMLKNTERFSLEQLVEFFSNIDCESLWEKDTAVIEEALGIPGTDQDEPLTVSRNRLSETESAIRAQFSGEQQITALQLVNSLFYINVKDALRKYGEYVKVTAGKLGKKIADLEVTGPEIYVDKGVYGSFLKSLVHIFRNIADHGIEKPDVRADAGKPESGRITCSLHREEHRFTLSISDDGTGIDAGVIAKKALEKGICTEKEIGMYEEGELLNLIFCSSFSTRDSADMLSGRGIGLSAVWESATQAGGTIRVETMPGRYTNFVFDMPA